MFSSENAESYKIQLKIKIKKPHREGNSILYTYICMWHTYEYDYHIYTCHIYTYIHTCHMYVYICTHIYVYIWRVCVYI